MNNNKMCRLQKQETAVRFYTAAGIDPWLPCQIQLKDFIAGDTQRKYADNKLEKSMRSL